MGIVTSIGLFVWMLLAAMGVDGLLHQFGRVGWGRWFGYVGVAVLLFSFLYSARKRKMILWGTPAWHLTVHEILAWLAAMMILVHGGIHFHAPLPWLAMGAMLVAVASGLTGKYLLKEARTTLLDKRKLLLEQGMAVEEMESKLYYESLLVDAMKNWRKVHIPITMIFAFLAILHVVTILLFWRVR